jgi:Fic family protein
MRKYEETHPWIKFTPTLAEAPYTLWLLLGEAQAKCEYIAGTPVKPDDAEQLGNIYLAKGAHATTAIEGNTLTEEQVQAIIESRSKIPTSQKYLEQQVRNIIDAFNIVGNRILQGDVRAFSQELLSEYNRLVLKDLELEEGVVAGAIRRHEVWVGKVYRGAPPQDLEYLVDEFSKWLNKLDSLPAKNKTAMNIVFAVMAHLLIAWIHPFGDGNGRTARLIEFKILLQAGIPAIAVHLLSNHYNKTRDEYYRQLDYASKSGGETFQFLAYALQGLVDGLNEQVAIIQDRQLRVLWRDHIYRSLDDKSTPTATRLKNLVLDLSNNPDQWVDFDDLSSISTRLMKAYGDKTERTLYRDVEELEKRGFLKRNPENSRQFKPNIESLIAFIPRRT